MTNLSTTHIEGDTGHLADHAELAAFHNLIDAKGDMIAGTGTDTAGRLAVGTDGKVLTADSSAAAGVSWQTPATGGGGGSIVSWTKLLNASPMSSLTGWTTRAGTWTPGGTYGVNQTANDSDDWLEWGTDLSGYDLRAIEATVRPTAGQKLGVGFYTDAGWNSGGVGIALDLSANNLWWDRYGIGGSTAAISGVTVAANTDYTLKVVERVAGAEFWTYVNGTLVKKILVSSGSLGRVGLYSRNGQGWWRAVSIWGGAMSFDLPS